MMFHLVIVFCSILAHQCAPIAFDSDAMAYATEQECRQAGAANVNRDPVSFRDYACVKH